MSRPNLDPPKNVHSYDSFMKKHLSNYGYYGNISEYLSKILTTHKNCKSKLVVIVIVILGSVVLLVMFYSESFPDFLLLESYIFL